MNRVGFFALHVLVHFGLYVVPVTLFNVFFRWPITALEWLIGEKEMSLAPRKERRIVIIKNHRAPCGSAVFGVPSHMYYEEPMYVGCVQTLLAALRPPIDVPFCRETLPTADAKALLYMDCLSPTVGRGAGGKALVLILPGIDSSSRAVNVRSLAMQLYHSGYHVVVLNARDSGGDASLYAQLLSGEQTDDLRHVLQTVLTPAQLQQRMKTAEPRPLIAVGFALGGVTLCTYIGEQGRRSKCTYLTAAIAMSAPFDSNALFAYLQRTHIHKRGDKRKNNNACGHQQAPTLEQKSFESAKYDNNKSKKTKNKSSEDKDGHPSADWPHAPTEAYAMSARLPEKFNSTIDVYRALHAAAVPVMCVTTHNDPLCGGPFHSRRWEALVNANANVIYVGMPTGGNLAFVESPIAELRQRPNVGEQLILHSLRNLSSKS